MVSESGSAAVAGRAAMARLAAIPQMCIRDRRLLAALNDNITRYEKEFGKIELPQQGGARTVAPFGTPKGEA